jgi:hypothetical protein
MSCDGFSRAKLALILAGFIEGPRARSLAGLTVAIMCSSDAKGLIAAQGGNHLEHDPEKCAAERKIMLKQKRAEMTIREGVIAQSLIRWIEI